MTVTGTRYASTRSRGLADWKPRATTIDVLNDIIDVLDQYREFWPLTTRQIG